MTAHLLLLVPWEVVVASGAMKGENDKEDSSVFRDNIAELFMKCRCDDEVAYTELKQLVSSCHLLSEDDALVAKGYLGDLLLSARSALVPYNEKRGKSLLSELSVLDMNDVTCHHLQRLLGIYLFYCCPDMKVEAFELCKRSAEQDSSLATLALGYFCEMGVGVREDKKKAFSCYQVSASKGYPVAQCNLGYCLEDGIGCDKNHVLAAQWYKKAAENGFARGHCFIGQCYRRGLGVIKNYPEALYHLTAATEKGFAEAYYRLGWCYKLGQGVSIDNPKCMQLIKRALELGFYPAAKFLAHEYEYGSCGVEIDVVEAVRYYRMAVKFGEEDAPHSRKRILILSDRYKAAVSSFILVVIKFY